MVIPVAEKPSGFLHMATSFLPAEESCDSSTMEGFNDRTFKMKSVKGKPEFYVKELITPNKDSKKYPRYYFQGHLLSKVDVCL